jgi:hypothetical protein
VQEPSRQFEVPYLQDVPSPYSPGVGPSGFGGNPINSGFAPGTSINSGMGGIVDMIINMLASSLTQKMGGMTMPSMGRPQVSDVTRTVMAQRDFQAQSMLPGVYGSAPSNRLFGPLGDNAVFQQYYDQFAQSGGSRGEAFKQTFGQFGTMLGGGIGPGEIEEAGRRSAQFVRNLDTSFASEMGEWQYGETAGFNRQNLIGAVAAFSKEFEQGKSAVDTMAQERVEPTKGGPRGGGKIGNTGKIDEAAKQIQEIAETVREAGNLFGPNMPFDQLMEELKIMTAGNPSAKTGDIKKSLQEVQAMAITVDMANEAFVNYMKVVDQIQTATGGRGSVKDLSIAAMQMGKAQEDNARAEAEKRGEVYTGKSKEEFAMDAARFVGNVTGSHNAVNVDAMIQTMESAGGMTEEVGKLLEFRNNQDYGGALEYFEQLKGEGKITPEMEQRIQQTFNLAREDDVIGQRISEANEDLAKKRLGGDYVPMNSENAVYNAAEQVLSQMDISDEAKDLIRSGRAFNEGKDASSPLVIAENLRKSGMSSERASKVAQEIFEGINNSMYTDQADVLSETFSKGHLEQREKIIAEQKKNREYVEEAAKSGYVLNSDEGVGERIMGAARDVYGNLQENGGSVSLKDFTSAMKERFGITDAEEAKKLYEQQKHRASYEKKKEELISAAGGADAIDAKQMEAIQKEAMEHASDEVFTKNSYHGKRQEKLRKYEEEEYKKVNPNSYASEDEARQDAQKRAAERLAEEDREMGLSGKTESEIKGEKKEESKQNTKEQNQRFEELTQALKDNKTAMEELVEKIGNWGKGIKEDLSKMVVNQ